MRWSCSTRRPGEANRVAVALDRLAWPDVVGTIAGDDTIFLAVKDGAAQRRVIGRGAEADGGVSRRPAARLRGAGDCEASRGK